MTIFGFNTDVNRAGTLYHVQSEARQSDLLLQTLIYVKGQCVGKHTVSYAQKLSQPGFSTEAMHELLKLQHKNVIEAIQRGEMDSSSPASVEIQDVGGSGLSLKWTNPSAIPAGPTLVMNLEVLDEGRAAAGARVVCWACGADTGSALARGETDASGKTDLHLPLNDDILRDSAVMVQAEHGNKSATRKFRLKKS